MFFLPEAALAKAQGLTVFEQVPERIKAGAVVGSLRFVVLHPVVGKDLQGPACVQRLQRTGTKALW